MSDKSWVYFISVGWSATPTGADRPTRIFQRPPLAGGRYRGLDLRVHVMRAHHTAPARIHDRRAIHRVLRTIHM